MNATLILSVACRGLLFVLSSVVCLYVFCCYVIKLFSFGEGILVLNLYFFNKFKVEKRSQIILLNSKAYKKIPPFFFKMLLYYKQGILFIWLKNA